MSHLGVTDVVDEGPVFSYLFLRHLLLLTRARLIVVQQRNERPIRRTLQRLVLHPREQWVLCLVRAPVTLRACMQDE